MSKMKQVSENAHRKLAAAAARKAGVEALLVTHLPDVRWLCGFTGSNAAFVLPASAKRRPILVTDGRYSAQARLEAKGVKIEIAPKSAVIAACDWAVNAGIRRCGFDDGNTSVAMLRQMQASIPANRRRGMFQAMGSLVSTLRWVKDADEIRRMRSSAALGCRLFENIFDAMVPGATEADVALALESQARRAGASEMSFPTIVASGPRSAMPHGRASSARLPRRGFVTLDFGVVLDGYCSDMTRTVHMGPASAQERDVYEAVLEAQESAMAAVRAGITAGDVDEAARSVLRRKKLDKWFTHSTGHGVGLEIHEGPRIAAKQTQTLEAGMIVTIEPGVYIPGKFGVRIEDMVLVTSKGAEVLTPSTKAWIEL
jgi:Xaa-Pro aminopeptidase